MLGRSRYDALGAAGRYRPEPFSNEVGLRGDGVTKYVIADAHVDLFDTVSDWTWLICHKIDASGVQYAVGFGNSDDSANIYGLRMGVGTGMDYGQFWTRRTSFVNLLQANTTQKVSDGVEHLWGVQDAITSGTTAAVKSSVDGAAYETLGSYNRASLAALEYLTIGALRHTTGTGGDVGGPWEDDLFSLACVRRAVDEGELADLNAYRLAHQMDLRKALDSYYNDPELLALNLWFGDGVDGDKLVNRGKYLGHPTKGTAQPVNVVDADFVLRAA